MFNNVPVRHQWQSDILSYCRMEIYLGHLINSTFQEQFYVVKVYATYQMRVVLASWICYQTTFDRNLIFIIYRDQFVSIVSQINDPEQNLFFLCIDHTGTIVES